ncbi:DUF1365 family protein [Erwinia sp. E602]|uniref:DUF1365 domain-containing protein n=1 Tax=unclassified Erwinia TaxID=2622719 RepID=UPI0006F446EB|nr:MULTISPECIES: DUF1365 domain-containing protein [unclassified Erwinia]KQN56921.1 chromosome partitioning protein ParA [Erwinia sp. Leaf53]PLV60685.1 plasmid partition ParA protein [Erwinia sp. B116]QUG76554.1 DUF1365 family protein [Erwinia sp. E602]
MNSLLYSGHVRHRRFTPVDHRFSYRIFMPLIDLDELPLLHKAGIGRRRFNAASFCADDYLGGGDIKQRAQTRIAELTGERLSGRVLLLTQLRYFGCSFNPVNFYYLYDEAGELRWMLAEVRNTPWNERHTYAVKPDGSETTEKAFHVSPFNPLEMVYHWRLSPPGRSLTVHIENHREGREFDATLHLRSQPLTRPNLRHFLWRFPLMTVRTALAIYWQAWKLWRKGAPVYDHHKPEK